MLKKGVDIVDTMCYHKATPGRKEAKTVPSAQESMDIKKAMAYDLLTILADKGAESYTPEEVEKIIKAYIAGLAQK